MRLGTKNTKKISGKLRKKIYKWRRADSIEALLWKINCENGGG
jgi:translation initiation factor IF-1